MSLPLLLQFAAFSAISHKEPRFIVFMAPLWLLGLGALVRKPDGWRTAAAWMALLGVVSAAGLFRLLPFERGVYPHPLVARSDVRQAYLVLSRRSDVTGLIDASATNWGETGGYYDLNQPAPIYRPDIPATQFRRAIRAPGLYHADYWLAKAGARPPGGFGQPERVGALVLWRRSSEAAVDDAARLLFDPPAGLRGHAPTAQGKPTTPLKNARPPPRRPQAFLAISPPSTGMVAPVM